MAEYSGWRNFWRRYARLIGATFILCLFGFPEKKYHHMHPNEIHNMVSEKKTIGSPGEKTTITTMKSSDIEKVTFPQLIDLSHAATAQRDPWLGNGRPSKQQFMLFQSNAHPFRSILLDLWIPWKFFAFPIVEFASFVVSWSASFCLTLDLTQSQAFAASPYNFKPLTIGYFNFASLVGGILGLVTAGLWSDWISMKLTKRNNGIREPYRR